MALHLKLMLLFILKYQFQIHLKKHLLTFRKHHFALMLSVPERREKKKLKGLKTLSHP